MTNDKPKVDTGAHGKLAEDIKVSLFRQIHHMPLVWQGEGDFLIDEICKDLTKTPKSWCEIENPLRALSKSRDDADPDVFNEVVYFHDFARDFLYPHGKNPAFRLFEKRNPGTITASFANNGGTHDFTIERLTLHIFRTKTAILTVETLHKAQEAPINLAQVQTIIDHFRRSYTPFWNDEHPSKVPTKLELSDGTKATKQKQSEMIKALEDNFGACADAPLLEPWASWLERLNLKDWRDPNDERVPVMSFILLKKTEGSNRDTLNQIRKSDWFRLAEADESGKEYAYNPAFLARLEAGFFYDRFMPDPLMPDYLATRHIFGGAHYCVVSVDDVQNDPKNSNFPRDIIQTHFRRHYEKMALAARFEFASLLAFSARITNAVKPLEDPKASKHTRDRFRADILTIHEEFLEFTHRYHFTGISSQIQASEMFKHWRTSQDLDRLYQDVKDEITSASQYAQTVQADNKANEANALARVAILVGALVSAPSLNSFALFKGMNARLSGLLDNVGWQEAGPLISFALPIILVFGIGEVLFRVLRWWGRRA